MQRLYERLISWPWAVLYSEMAQFARAVSTTRADIICVVFVDEVWQGLTM